MPLVCPIAVNADWLDLQMLQTRAQDILISQLVDAPPAIDIQVFPVWSTNTSPTWLISFWMASISFDEEAKISPTRFTNTKDLSRFFKQKLGLITPVHLWQQSVWGTKMKWVITCIECVAALILIQTETEPREFIKGLNSQHLYFHEQWTCQRRTLEPAKGER